MRKYNWTFVLASAMLLPACRDVIEEDLSDDTITVLVPPDNHITSDNVVLFKWEEVDFTQGYDFQLVEPGFDNMVYFHIDSTLSGTEKSFALYPGEYEWRVRAANSNSETPWVTRSLIIDSTNNLNGQTVLLNSPADPAYLNTSAVTFEWSGLAAATQYEWRLYDTNASGIFLSSAQTTNPSHTAVLNEGLHEWTVEASNATSSTGEFGNTLYMDLTAPGSPVPAYPLNDAFVGDSTMTFTWTQAAATGTDPTPVFDSIYFVADSTNTVTYKFETNGTTHTDSLGVGIWYWKVQTFDWAGNSSVPSFWRKITIQ